MLPFQPWDTPVEPGITLIEASAGTGKTFAIICVVLRLLIEQKLPLEKILIVTYTEAATAELRARLRKALHEAEACLTAVEPPENSKRASRPPEEGNTSERPGGKAPGDLPPFIRRKPAALEAIRNAIATADLAQVRTIHGFCAGVLHDNAFETGSLFESQLLPSDPRLIREILEDYWRLRISSGPALLTYALLARGCSLEKLELIGAKLRTTPEAELEVPHEGLLSLEEEHQNLAGQFQRAIELYSEVAGAVRQEMKEFGAGHTFNKGYSAEMYERMLDQLDSVIGTEQIELALCPLIELAPSSLLEGVNKTRKYRLPKHPFFQVCEELRTASERCRDAFHRDAAEYLLSSIQKRRDHEGIRGYSDLLIEVAERLRAEDGDKLRLALLDRYKAALIDEYQDTDPLQYQIFHTLFADSPEHSLYLIGDPKQSIFGFRGADIHTYLRTNAEANRRFTLTHNYRSSPGFIQSLNELYRPARNPFVFSEIEFHPVTSGQPDLKELQQGNDPVPAIQVDSIADKEIRVVEFAPQWAALRAAELLSRKLTIDGRPVVASDIAIITRQNADALRIQNHLRELGIPAVLQKSGNLFRSEEALELERLLCALLEYSRHTLVRTALLTPFFDWTFDDLIAIEQDPTRWERQLEGILESARTWQTRGFSAMFQQLLEREKVLPRLLARIGGERKIVNYLHLMESIERTIRIRRLSTEEILHWLRESRLRVDDAEMEEAELRLESDEKAVKLVTIHKSKGLEFPIVIAPDLWRSSFRRTDNGVAVITDNTGRKKIHVSESVPKEYQEIARGEGLSESARLLYVAVTRAKYHCSLLWSNCLEKDNALLLVLPPERVSSGMQGGSIGTRPLSSLEPLWQNLSEAELGEQTLISSMPPRSMPTRELGRAWSIYSFSSLKKKLEERTEQVELEQAASAEDELLAPIALPDTGNQFQIPPVPAPDTPDLIDAPELELRGTRFGAMLHTIYERHRFSRPEELDERIRTAMREQSFAERHKTLIKELIENSIHSPCLHGASPAMIPETDLLKELEFHFPTSEKNALKLQQILQNRTEPSGRFTREEGFLKGFIDVLFQREGRYYIIDWKSNYLGADPKVWQPDALAESMKQFHYNLQSFLYTAAVDRFLRLRLPGYSYEAHFGGVYYLFVRGMKATQPQQGVYFERLSEADIAEFNA